MDHVAVLLPGRGYGVAQPVLRWPALVMEAAGARVAPIAYPGGPETAWELAAGGRWEELTSVLAPVLREAIGGAEQVTLIGKSLGAAIMSQLGGLGLPVAEAVWLTPLFGDDVVREGAAASGWRSLSVYGTADVAHDPRGQAAVTGALNGIELAVAGANHALEVPGDPHATAEAHVNLVDAVTRLIADRGC